MSVFDPANQWKGAVAEELFRYHFMGAGFTVDDFGIESIAEKYINEADVKQKLPYHNQPDFYILFSGDEKPVSDNKQSELFLAEVKFNSQSSTSDGRCRLIANKYEWIWQYRNHFFDANEILKQDYNQLLKDNWQKNQLKRKLYHETNSCPVGADVEDAVEYLVKNPSWISRYINSPELIIYFFIQSVDKKDLENYRDNWLKNFGVIDLYNDIIEHYDEILSFRQELPHIYIYNSRKFCWIPITFQAGLVEIFGKKMAQELRNVLVGGTPTESKKKNQEERRGALNEAIKELINLGKNY